MPRAVTSGATRLASLPRRRRGAYAKRSTSTPSKPASTIDASVPATPATIGDCSAPKNEIKKKPEKADIMKTSLWAKLMSFRMP